MTFHFMAALWLDDGGIEITEPVLITKRGVPIVRIDHVSTDISISNVWTARKNFIKKYGSIDEDIEIPERSIDIFRNPLDE